MSLDAMKQALEALEMVTVDIKTTPNAYEASRQAITALRSAIKDQETQAENLLERMPVRGTLLEQTLGKVWDEMPHPDYQKEMEREPVAWMHNYIEDNVITHRPADLDRHPDRWEALYKTPPPCQTCEALARTVMMDQTSHDMFRYQWQGLTDEEVLGAGNASGLKAKMTSNGIIIHPDGIKNFYRAIEAKLREKNHG